MVQKRQQRTNQKKLKGTAHQAPALSPEGEENERREADPTNKKKWLGMVKRTREGREGLQGESE
jgi:hypothetical protein